jgi:hypothetical protein
MLMALWPIFAAILGGFAYGIYAWVNTKRDAKDALKLGAQNSEAIAQLNTRTEQHADRLARLEARQTEIAEGIKWMRANWWPRRRK